ncbi:hypothetical protein A2867_02705 [Candidatus Daviesbacteria bacterium RIFCSPHIGHO2_01_FULL_40_11]|uniref:Uncharacterized protein n=1 Tax=Candidatus Daviesbacteria bacterium RIFCSPHIGHO2_01_FULL_40_11 TaxID=1797762 RepID=A0A1F5JHJ0_9BACT|nr:MAG: hypothetical protein A2867_02705 [Candidatus Daviesbacteria bacterium RIFCSPHIGHO2_01_FULL_40_11]
MKYLSKIFCFIICLTFIVRLVPSVYASEYKVKGIILVPADLKDYDRITGLGDARRDVISSFKAAQKFYAAKLNGKTFSYDDVIDVVYSDKNSERGIAPSMYDIYRNLGGDKLIKPEAGVVKAVWILGGLLVGVMSQGGAISKDSGMAFFALNDPMANRDFIVAHELGHAFGLVESGYAKGHPCTIVSTIDCVTGAPEPLPGISEWTGSVMGYGSNLTGGIVGLDFPFLGFNNSVYNPEIWKLYQSPFINPQGDSAPSPADPGSFQVKINHIYPSPIQAGSTVTLAGQGFGYSPGRVEIYNTAALGLYITGYSVSSWAENTIEIKINEDAVDGTELSNQWKIRLIKGNGQSAQSPEFTITPKIIKVAPGITPIEQPKNVKILQVSSSVIPTKDVLEIIGDNLQLVQDVVLYIPGEFDPEDSSSTLKTQIIKKSDRSIEVQVDKDAVEADVQQKARLKVITANNVTVTAPQEIIIQGEAFTTSSMLTMNFQVTCGDDRQPLPGASVSFRDGQGEAVLVQGKADDKGEGTLSYTVISAKPGDKYKFVFDFLPGEDSESFEGQSITYYIEQSFRPVTFNKRFNHSRCPKDTELSPTPIPISTTIGTAEPTPFPSGSLESNPSPTPVASGTAGSTPSPAISCPAPADNCVYSQDGQCYSGYTSDTSTCTWINDTCLNPTAGCAYSCGPLVSCPSSATVKPTPVPSSSVEPTWVPTPYSSSMPTPSSVSEPTQVLISNYVDFRSDNAPTDAGSSTMTINNPSGQTVTWKLSTLIPSPTRRVFVRAITGEEYKDYEPLEMRDGEMVTVAGIKIQAKMIKKVVRMTITVNGQDQEIDLNNPQEIIMRLLGIVGQAQGFSLPYVIEYSDGEIIRSAFQINYQPRITNPSLGPSPVSQPSIQPTPLPTTESTFTPQPTETPVSACGDFVPKYNECFACNKSRKVLQNSCGQFDNTEINPGIDPACASWCSSADPESNKKIVRVTVNEQEIDPTELDSGFGLDLPGVAGQPQVFSIPVVVYYSDGSSRNLAYIFNYQPNSPSAPGCTEVRRYNECTACNTSREISQDSCGNYTSVVESQYDEGCASWCSAPEPSTESAPASQVEGQCDDLYYFDSNVDSCIHKFSPDSYPNCTYVFDQVERDLCP